MPRARVLLTGFEPFGGQRLNASQLAVEPLEGKLIEGREVRVLVLPCVFGRAIPELRAEIRRCDPELVVATGEAATRFAVSLERVAINVDDARIADNAGAMPIDRPVVARGPVAYFSTLPIKTMSVALRERAIPAEVSQSAGTFVCNHVFYGLMHTLAARRGVRGGFIHLPVTPAQARRGDPCMPREIASLALETAISVALTTRRDARVGGGTLS